MKVSAIIVAAGKGERMGSSHPKQYLELNGRPIICHTLDSFLPFKEWDISIGVAPERVEVFRSDIIRAYGYPNDWRLVAGGVKRQDTVRNAIMALPKETEIVLVHDGVRPFVARKILEKSVIMASEFGGCIVAARVVPTLKEVDENGLIVRTVDRASLWEAQTPQAFRKELLLDAMNRAYIDGFYGTDEASLLERLGKSVCILEGASINIKITRPEDLMIAEGISHAGRDRLRHT